MEIKGRIWTIPNILSVCRLLMLIPIFICLVRVQRGWAVFWMGLGVLTDFLDGYIARHYNQRSDLGRIMDPVIDKVNVLSVSFFWFSPLVTHSPSGFFCSSLSVN